MRKVERLLQEQRVLRYRTWERYCSKDYPERISLEQFLTTILHQAKKTYHRCVRSYTLINWCEEDLYQKLLRADRSLTQLFNDVATVRHTFRTYLEKSKQTRVRYDVFLVSLEEFAMGVFDDRIRVFEAISEIPAEKAA